MAKKNDRKRNLERVVPKDATKGAGQMVSARSELADDECLGTYEAAVGDTDEEKSEAERQEIPPRQEEPYLLKVIRGEVPSLLLGDRFMTDAAKQKMKEAEATANDSAWQALTRKLKERRESRTENESQKAELATLKTEVAALKAEAKTVNELPTLHEFTYKIEQLTQKLAAGYLRCTTRTIRNLIQKGKLTKTKNGKVKCDGKWAREVRNEHPNVRVK